MKRVLVLDDLRTLVFPGEYNVLHARTVVHAAVELLRGGIDILVLDHDLGPDEARRLVTFIEQQHHTGCHINLEMVYIVSSNPQAHKEFPALRNCGYTVQSGIGTGTVDHEETALWNEAARMIDGAGRPYGAEGE